MNFAKVNNVESPFWPQKTQDIQFFESLDKFWGFFFFFELIGETGYVDFTNSGGINFKKLMKITGLCCQFRRPCLDPLNSQVPSSQVYL